MKVLLSLKLFREQAEEIYSNKGFKDFHYFVWAEFLKAEAQAYKEEYSIRKGELAELLLEYMCVEMQKYFTDSMVLKGLVLPFKGSDKTTELDITFITPQRIYLFESKAYNTGISLTDKCLCSNGTDVYSQNVLHLKTLRQYIGFMEKPATHPYTLAMFEMSSKGIIDNRSVEWKKKFPLVSAKDSLNGLASLLSNNTPAIWNVQAVVKILVPYIRTSSKRFDEHLEYMKNLKEKR